MAKVKQELLEGVCVLRLDNGKANAMARAVSLELIAALDEAEKTASAVLILGRPGIFSGGFDLGTIAEGGEAALEMIAEGLHLLVKILEHPKPIVVGCSGHAIAMGVFLVLAADERIGARGDFKIGMNETAIGMTLPEFAVELARTRLSKRHFDRAAVHATIYDPDAAVDVGFLDRVVEPDRLEDEALQAAIRLGALPQPAFRNNKRLANAPLLGDAVERFEAKLRRQLGR
ncbi:MAG: crotonase/enoyl-CoA hydratase family protein [Deltaproteobacteria bacterium]|jgi:enoyl-CoA hydratase|nr:crotonase/enoyl-CoA hydratase family protein [Deltaproteobacteria bacterium]